MSESGAHTLIETMEEWALTIGQPVLVLLVFALYYIQAWTTQSPVQISVNRHSSGGITLSVSGETGGADRRSLIVAWADAGSSVHNETPISVLSVPSDMTKALMNPI
jgi:hypothetical protein